jgi:hypothetical protein
MMYGVVGPCAGLGLYVGRHGYTPGTAFACFLKSLQLLYCKEEFVSLHQVENDKKSNINSKHLKNVVP